MLLYSESSMNSHDATTRASPSTAFQIANVSENGASQGITPAPYPGTAPGDGPLPMPRSHFAGVGRHTLGIILLLTTVFLWTASNFLASVSNIDALTEKSS